MSDVMVIVIGIALLGLTINIITAKKEEKPEFCKTHKWLFDNDTGKLFCCVCKYRP